MEEWRDIEEFEGLYQVSNLGRVRGLDRVDSDGNRRKGKIKGMGFASKKGYAVVCLNKTGKQYMRYVHRLVARAFHGEIPNGYCVNHKNYDILDNKSSNLEILTLSENALHGKMSDKRDYLAYPI
jgi:hypothetical protein